MIVNAEMDFVLFDVNEELKKRDMQIESLKEQNQLLMNSLMKLWKESQVNKLSKEEKSKGMQEKSNKGGRRMKQFNGRFKW